MKLFTYVAVAVAAGFGCATQEVIYSNNGVELVQVQGNTGIVTRGFSVLVKEEEGESMILVSTPNRSLLESLAIPAGNVGAAALARHSAGNVTSRTNIEVAPSSDAELPSPAPTSGEFNIPDPFNPGGN